MACGHVVEDQLQGSPLATLQVGRPLAPVALHRQLPMAPMPSRSDTGPATDPSKPYRQPSPHPTGINFEMVPVNANDAPIHARRPSPGGRTVQAQRAAAVTESWVSGAHECGGRHSALAGREQRLEQV